MDLIRAMRLFRRVVELRHFSAAARELRLSNASVSKEIAALEEHLRTTLLHRTTRRVSLTTAGAGYYERCIRILDEIDEAERALSQPATSPTGTLRVNVPMSFGLLHVSPLLPEMLARWPGLRLDVSFTDRFVDVVEEGADLVIRIASELPDSASLTAQKLAQARHVLCAAPAYLAKHGAPETPEELAAHECIVYSLGRAPDAWTFQGPRGPSRVQVRGRLRADSSLVIREAARRGVGIALLPSFYVGEELARGELVRVLADHELPLFHVHAVHPRSKHVASRVRVVVELLKERFSKSDWAAR